LSREEGLSYKEIAAQLEVSTKTVENQIGIALKRIRKRVNTYTKQNQLGGISTTILALIITKVLIDLGVNSVISV
jgi:predicted DNA-binding protein (UPF0251 family)